MTLRPFGSPGEQSLKVQVLLPAAKPPKAKKEIVDALDGPVATRVTSPSSGGTYLSISVAPSNDPLLFVSTQTMRPAAQSFPEEAHDVELAAMHIWTGLLRTPASLRAKDKSLTNSLTWAVNLLLITKRW